MPEMNDIVKLAVDTYHGKVEKYSMSQSLDVLHEAIVEANNGKDYLDIRDIRDGKCTRLFSLIETILANTVVEGFQGDEAFMNAVEFRNVPAGDKPVFIVEDSNLYTVRDGVDGNQGVRRQRAANRTAVEVPTAMRYIRIYEELSRVLSNRVDIVQCIDKVQRSFRQDILSKIYTLWASDKTDENGSKFNIAGSYAEDKMLDLISDVEAAAGGKQATIVGTMKAVRNLKESIISETAKDELHNMGYCGKFFGTPVVALPQTFKPGTKTRALNDNVLTVYAGDEKPIKVVYEGDPIVIPGQPEMNADLTQEYLYGMKYGVGLILSGDASGMGTYTMS